MFCYVLFLTESKATATSARKQRHHIRSVQLVRLPDNQITTGCGFAPSVARFRLVIFLHPFQVLAHSQ